MDKIRRKLTITDYALSNNLGDLGVKITIPGVSGYNKKSARSMRLDVLCGFRKLLEIEKGMSWDDFGKWLDEEFLPKNKK